VESDNPVTNTPDSVPENLESTVEQAPDTGSASADPFAALSAELDKLAGEKAELHDLLLRRQAEFENYRKRVERERSEFIQYASMEMVGSLLPVLDDFERAIKSGADPDSDYRRGVELIYARLFDTLKKAGLEPIEAIGKDFDPNVHQAVVREERSDVPEHTVLDVFQSGDNFKGKLLRPAMVKVAVVPA
jgi:molecular chaperone GrpE